MGAPERRRRCWEKGPRGWPGPRRGPALGTEFRTLGLAKEQWEGAIRLQVGKDVIRTEVWETRSGLSRENKWKDGMKGNRGKSGRLWQQSREENTGAGMDGPNTDREREFNPRDRGGGVNSSGDRLDVGAERQGNSRGWCHVL